MAKIIELKLYREKKKQSWLQANEEAILLFIANYLSHSEELREFFQTTSIRRDYSSVITTKNMAKHEKSWDYQKTRDLLHEYISKNDITRLYEALSQQVWFKPEKASKELVLELALKFYMTKLVS